jgi:NADH dehydrogenase
MDLIVGATGFVGGLAAKKLRERGRAVRALVRGGAANPKAGPLASAGTVIVDGDLTDAASLARACEGVECVLCTVTAMPNAPGDALQRIDHDGVLGLIRAAERAGARRFVYLSYSANIQVDSPLQRAKRDCEAELASSRMEYVVLRPTNFMEVWLGPHLGFDAAAARARIYGDGQSPVSYVSGADVAGFAATAMAMPGAPRESVQVGGPEAISQLGAVAIFERALGRRFAVEHVPLAALEAQHRAATDPLQKTFAALSIAYARGDAIPEARENAARFGVDLTTLESYAGRMKRH